MPCFYLKPKQDNSNQELQTCIAEALYDVDSIVADPGAYTKEELATLHSQIVSNLDAIEARVDWGEDDEYEEIRWRVGDDMVPATRGPPPREPR